VTGLLRFIGILNAATWLGAAVFFTFGAGPAVTSPDVEKLLGPKNFPFFSEAIHELLLGRFFGLQVACAVVALLHVLSERLYLGKSPEKVWFGLLLALFTLAVAESSLVGPKLAQLNKRRFAPNLRVEERQAAAESFQTWRSVLLTANFFGLGALGFYLWHISSRADPMRFVSANKFRS